MDRPTVVCAGNFHLISWVPARVPIEWQLKHARYEKRLGHLEEKVCPEARPRVRSWSQTAFLLLPLVLLFLSALPHPTHADNTGLVGYWSFDEGTATSQPAQTFAS
jgi:hypothetical protein